MVNLLGGNKYLDYVKELARKLQGKPKVRIGFFDGATYPDGTPVALVAAFNEFGTRNSPPRPFFRDMIAAKKHEWGPAMGNLLIANQLDVHKTLEITGEAIAGQLRDSITTLTAPPLADSTIIKKGGHAGMKYDAKDPSTNPAKPLIDTGFMLSCVGSEVIK